MKKVLAFVSSLLLLGTTAAFADVSVKKLDDGNVEVTFFYANPRAGEVLLAGDFTNWQDGAEAMTKTDTGYTLTKTVPAGTVMKYKFISDGNWTEDMHEPDKIDDGFGGHNGLVDVDELVAASAPSADGAATASKKSSVKFATWSMAGVQNKWAINNGLKEDSAGLGVKSYWKFSGNITPHVPVYAEIAVAENDGFSNIYSSTNTNVLKNLYNMGVDLISNPIEVANGGASAATYLGHFKTGFDSPYVSMVSGYKYAKLAPHTNVNWVTVDQEWEAGYNSVGGYAQFSDGSAVKEAVSNLTNGMVDGLEVVVAPNKAADRAGGRYGLYAYADATVAANHYVDVQYNAAYGTTYDTFLKPGLENDVILGYRGNFGPVTVKANGLVNFYGSTEVSEGYKSLFTPASSDVGAVSDVAPIMDNMAANVSAYFSNDYVDATIGYRFRGDQASMMYVEEGADDHTNISDQLGDLNRQRVYADVTAYPTDFLSVGVAPYVEMTWNKDADSSFDNAKNIKIYAKPSAEFYLGDFIDLDAAVDCYAEVAYNTKDTASYAGNAASKIAFNEAGLHFGASFDSDVLSSLDVTYAYDANDDDMALHTVIAEAALPFGINAQAGAGLRTAANKLTTTCNPFGFFVGANKQINTKYKTILYTQFVYGMDPYNAFGDGQEALNLDEYTIDSDADNYADAAAVRVALRFEF